MKDNNFKIFTSKIKIKISITIIENDKVDEIIIIYRILYYL